MRRTSTAILIFASALCFTVTCRAPKEPFLAYSLKEAEYRLQHMEQKSRDLLELSGITRLAGMVYDENSKDLIVVGQVDKQGDRITLDDLVVAMRSVLLFRKAPLVSIDRTEETRLTGQQTVRFQGGIENTKFGADMLRADIALKKLSLGLLPSKVHEVQSYLSMSVDRLKQELLGAGTSEAIQVLKRTDYYYSLSHDQLQKAVLKRYGDILPLRESLELSEQPLADYTRIGSRFWLYPHKPSLVVRHGVFAIQELDVDCLTQVLYAIIDGNPQQDLSQTRDEIGDAFSTQVALDFGSIARENSELGRVKTLFDLAALCSGIELLQPEPSLDYWLRDYPVRLVKIDTTVGIIASVTRIADVESRFQLLEISGGLELDPLVLRLEAGDVTALREAVLKSRPEKEHVLTWEVPLEVWKIPGAGKYFNIDVDESERANRRGGFSIDIRLFEIGAPRFNTEDYLAESFYPFDGAGINIDPSPKPAGRTRPGLWDKVLISRPSDSALYWDIKIPK